MGEQARACPHCDNPYPSGRVVCPWCFQRTKTEETMHQVLADAEKEFDEMARTGFGVDGSEQDVLEDFREVRGSYNENRFVRQLQSEIEQVKHRVKAFL